MLAGAIDIGGTKTALALVREDGTILGKDTFPTPPGTYEGCFSLCCGRLRELLKRCGADAGDLDGLGINVPGMYSPADDLLVRAPFAGWKDVRVCEFFREEFHIEHVYADNDVNSCALAECRFGLGKRYSGFFWMTVSTGIGGAVTENGRLIRGCHNLAGEIGHVKVAYGAAARVCSCGAEGCLEAHASGSAIGAMARRQCAQDDSFRTAFETAGLTADAKGCAVLARGGNRKAAQIYETAALYLARGIAVVENILDPEAVILGGGVAESLDLLLPAIRRYLPEYTVQSASDIPILHTGLGYDAALYGAAAQVFDSAGI